MIKLIFIAMMMLFWVCSVFAQNAISAKTSTTIHLAVGTSKTSEMNFGKFTSHEKGGEIILTTASERYATGGIKIIARNEQAEAAKFVLNNGNSAYAVLLPENCMIVRQDGSEKMKLCYFNYRTSLQPEDGKEIISIGATLNVNAKQKAGLYTPTTPFCIIFNYN